MKRNTNNTSIITVGRKFGWLPLVSCAAMLILAGCTADDTLTGNVASDTPVAFTTGIESVALPGTKSPTPDTRTVIGADGNAAWTQGDRVGIFMYKAGGFVLDDILCGAENIAYSVDPLTGALSPDGTPIFYPKDQAVSFAAYHPYQSPTFLRSTPIGDQTTVEKQSAVDYLYSDNAQDIRSGRNPVALEFRHLLSKIKFDITLGDGLADGQITKAVMQRQNIGFTVDLQKGQVYQSGDPRYGPISMLRSTTPTAGADATFTALVHDVLMGTPIVITVNDTEYTGTLTMEWLESNRMYVYPVTVRRTGVDVGEPTIALWDTNSNGSGTATELTVRIPAGTFMMGSPTTEPNRLDDETQHEVTLTKNFYISKYEITSQQYAEFLNDIGMAGAEIGANVSYIVEGYGEKKLFKVNAWGWTPKWNETTHQWEGVATQPMLYVSWYGAKAYADWIGGALPTEAQWEYACRAGTTTAYWFGGDVTELGEYAWYVDNSVVDNRSDAHEVGGKSPNPWGLYDMYGNAKEWCADWHGDFNSTPQKDPIGPVSGEDRVLRGGSYMDGSELCRSAHRDYDSPETTGKDYGFRIVFVP